MSGETTFDLTAQDNVDAIRTHTGRVFGKLSWALLGVAFLFPLLDVWAGVSILEDTAFWICLALALFFIGWDQLAKDWAVRRAFRQSEPMRSPITIKWDDQAIAFETRTSTARYEWKQFYRWMASRSTLLVYRDSQFMVLIPRRALPDEAYREIVDALRSAGVREKGLFQSAQSKPISS